MIRHSLDLVVRLVDTTTGLVVEEGNVRFWKNAEAAQPIPRGNGNYVFLNRGREDCTLEIQVRGYERCRIDVRYEELDKLIPIQDAFLIPSEELSGGQPVLSLTGRLSGLKSIQAVYSGLPVCTASGFDERKRIMTLIQDFPPGAEGVPYGLIHSEGKSYEPFVVSERISRRTVRLAQTFAEPVTANSPISRIVFGQVDEEGNYCLRVRDDSDRLHYLIRYVTDGGIGFLEADFHDLTQVKLE